MRQVHHLLRRLAILSAFLLFLIACAAALVWYYKSDQQELIVSVQNVGLDRIRQLTIIVSGRTYSIGDVPPGDTVSVAVEPRGESHLEVEFVSIDDNVRRLNLGGYFESGYRGSIKVKVNSDGLVDQQWDVHL